jgi:hypothetical protein
MNSTIFDKTPAAQLIDVTVSLNGKVKTRNLKLCRVKARLVLLISIDKEARINTFFKIKYSDISEYDNISALLRLKDGILPEKWESPWDSISVNPVKMSPWVRQHGTFSKHSQGWAPKLPSTTNNSVSGFPMV